MDLERKGFRRARHDQNVALTDIRSDQIAMANLAITTLALMISGLCRQRSVERELHYSFRSCKFREARAERTRPEEKRGKKLLNQQSTAEKQCCVEAQHSFGMPSERQRDRAEERETRRRMRRGARARAKREQK